MSNIKFEQRKTIEQVEESNELAPKFDRDGLIPVVTTDFNSGEVLMQGYMNEEALEKTKATKLVTFYSRTKQRLWTKGEESGNVLNLVDLKDKNTIFGVPHVSLQNKNKIVKYNGNRTPEDLEKWFLKSNIIGGKKKTIKRKWSLKYKRSIKCKKPKGFSQKQYCKRVNKKKRTIKRQRKR